MPLHYHGGMVVLLQYWPPYAFTDLVASYARLNAEVLQLPHRLYMYILSQSSYYVIAYSRDWIATKIISNDLSSFSRKFSPTKITRYTVHVWYLSSGGLVQHLHANVYMYPRSLSHTHTHTHTHTHIHITPYIPYNIAQHVAKTYWAFSSTGGWPWVCGTTTVSVPWLSHPLNFPYFSYHPYSSPTTAGRKGGRGLEGHSILQRQYHHCEQRRTCGQKVCMAWLFVSFLSGHFIFWLHYWNQMVAGLSSSILAITSFSAPSCLSHVVIKMVCRSLDDFIILSVLYTKCTWFCGQHCFKCHNLLKK